MSTSVHENPQGVNPCCGSYLSVDEARRAIETIAGTYVEAIAEIRKLQASGKLDERADSIREGCLDRLESAIVNYRLIQRAAGRSANDIAGAIIEQSATCPVPNTALSDLLAMALQPPTDQRTHEGFVPVRREGVGL